MLLRFANVHLDRSVDDRTLKTTINITVLTERKTDNVIGS